MIHSLVDNLDRGEAGIVAVDKAPGTAVWYKAYKVVVFTVADTGVVIGVGKVQML
jgi:hypothetical protein